LWGSPYIHNQATTQLSAQKVFFPPAAAFVHPKAGSEITPSMIPSVSQYAWPKGDGHSLRQNLGQSPTRAYRPLPGDVGPWLRAVSADDDRCIGSYARKGVSVVSAFFKLIAAGPMFFVSAWLLMLFAGATHADVGIAPFGYLTSMVVTIGLWLTLAPAIGAAAKSTFKTPKKSAS